MIIPPRVPAHLDKPLMRLRFGIWVCRSISPFVCGCGYTPLDSYREWERIQRGEPWEPLPVEPAAAERE